jgi:hypothetical protein
MEGDRNHYRPYAVKSVGTLAEHLQGNVELGGSEKGESTGCVHTAPISNVVFKPTYSCCRRLVKHP